MARKSELGQAHSTLKVSVTVVGHGDEIILPRLPDRPICIWEEWTVGGRVVGNRAIWRVVRGLGDGILRLCWRRFCGDGRRGLDGF